MTKPLLLAILLAVPLALNAQDRGQAPDAEEAAWLERQAATTHAYHARVVEGLAKSRGARELAFAAILRRLSSSDEAMPAGDAPSRPAPRDADADRWLRSAAAGAGSDVLANQLLVAANDPGSAGRREAAGRWQAADPGNLAPLLASGTPADQLLPEARRATRVDARMYDGVRWIASIYGVYPPTPAERAVFAEVADDYVADEAAALMAMSTWHAVATPPYTNIIEACRGTALRASPTRQADCRHVATLLADHSGSAMERSIGLAMLRELAAGNAERTAIDARRRTMDWQMLQWGRIAQQQPRDGAGQFVRLLRDDGIATEQQLVERVLQEAGVPLEPPAGWSPPRY